jgi:hypothetical protein
MILNDKKLYKDVLEPSPSSIVWRYMSLPKFLYLINYSELFFCRLDKLSDQLEGTLPIKNKTQIQEEIFSLHFTISNHFASDFANHEEENINSSRQYTLASCWSKNEDESFALWKLYLDGHKYGIAVQTTYQKIKNSICSADDDILFGEVIYDDSVNDVKQSTLNFRKNKYYSFENELRAIILNQYIINDSKEKLPKYEIGKYIKVKLNELIEAVYISPLAPEWFNKLVADIIFTQYKLSFPIKGSKIKEVL